MLCVETETLKLKKGNAWNALKQETFLFPMAQIFEADSMMKQWQLLEVFFKGISCYTHPVIQGKVRFIQVPNYLPEVCAQGEGT